MIKKIYFDMDGVLADFDGGVTKLCGLKPLMPGAVELFKELYERYGDKCELLTAIPQPKRGILNSGNSILLVKRIVYSRQFFFIPASNEPR